MNARLWNRIAILLLVHSAWFVRPAIASAELARTSPETRLAPGAFFADGRRSTKAVALSFDDGPGPFTLQVAEVLAKYQVKASFFVNGQKVEAHPEIVKALAAQGHEIGDHTYQHLDFHRYEKEAGLPATKAMIAKEMSRSHAAIFKVLGVYPSLCRMPHGFHRPWLGAIAAQFGYTLVNWSFGEDWKKLGENELRANYLAHVSPGAILLLHDGGPQRQKTVNIISDIIAHALSKGLAIVTVSSLLKPAPTTEEVVQPVK